MIDLTPMVNAVDSLTDSLALLNEFGDKLPERVRLLMRRGLIQTFEYNYELSIGMMTRYLRTVVPALGQHDIGNFPELIRVADEHGLIRSPFSDWKNFRQARNNTSHTYDGDKALAVVQVIPAFEQEVTFLLARLQEKVGR